MIRGKLDIIQQHPALPGNGLTLRYELPVLKLASYTEYPFLLSLFAFNNADHSSHGNRHEDDHSVFNSFHNFSFNVEPLYI